MLLLSCPHSSSNSLNDPAWRFYPAGQCCGARSGTRGSLDQKMHNHLQPQDWEEAWGGCGHSNRTITRRSSLQEARAATEVAGDLQQAGCKHSWRDQPAIAEKKLRTRSFYC